MRHAPGSAAIGGCILLVSMHTSGCAGVDAGAAAESSWGPSEQWTVSAAPLVEIGVVEGDDHYELHEASSSVRLRDGRIVVLNAGSHELRFYDARGDFLQAVGGRGSGPGEFRRPERIYALAADTILVYDAGLSRETWFTGNGAFARASEIERSAEKWARDAWLYGRSFVDGPRSPAARAAVRAALDRLPALTSGFRYVMVDERGRLWVRNGTLDPAGPTEWVVYAAQGSPLARVTTPRGFEPQHIGGDFILGRVRDDMNVEFIRLYAFATPRVASPDPVHPSRAAAPPRVAVPSAAVPSDAVRERMRSLLRALMVQQELFYSRPENGYRYAARADQLELPGDLTDVEVHVLRGDARGWTALLFHRGEPVACGVTTGAGGPIGWTPGVIVCE